MVELGNEPVPQLQRALVVFHLLFRILLCRAAHEEVVLPTLKRKETAALCLELEHLFEATFQPVAHVVARQPASISDVPDDGEKARTIPFLSRVEERLCVKASVVSDEVDCTSLPLANEFSEGFQVS